MSEIETVLPYGNPDGAIHFRFSGDYKTFCGRNCEGWIRAGLEPSTQIDSAYCCSRCRTAYLKSFTIPALSDTRMKGKTMADSKKHIQAPWKYRPNEHDDWGRVVGSDGLTICYARVSRFTPEQQQAHREKGTDPVEGIARLIAAAPDLLEALKQCRDAMYADNPADGWLEIITSADAAIARAECRS